MCRRSPIFCALIALASFALAMPALGATGEILIQTGSEPGVKCVTSPNTFDVVIQIANLSDAVNGVQARFSYDPALMTLDSSTEVSGWLLISLSDSPAGTATYAAINNTGGSFGPGVGPYTVATLHFTSVAQGTSSISFRADDPPLLTKLTTAGLDPQTIAGSDLTKSNSGSIAIDLPTAPSSASVDRNNFCADDAGDISLSAVGGAGATLAWYTDSCGGTSVGSGTPLVLASPTVTTTYYARWEHPCGNSACASVTVTVNSMPVAPSSASVDSPMYCSDAVPATIELTATGGSGDSLQWYSGSCGGTSVGSGSTLVIAAPTSTTTYYARWETASCGNSTCASVTVTVNASPVAPISASVDSPMYCSDAVLATIELTAAGGSGDSLEWYSDSCGGTPVGSGTPLIIAAPTSSTTYYARWETSACGDSDCESVTVTVNASPVAPTSASVDAPSYCADAVPATIELTATGGSGDSLEWYSGSCGGTPVGTGSLLVIAAPTGTTTYYARWETSACGDSACASVTVTVNPTPVAPTSAGVNTPSYCADAVPATIELTASGGSGDTLEWFSGSCGGVAVGTDTPLVIAAPTNTTTYYVRWTNGCGSSSCASVTVTVNPTPVAPTSASVDAPMYCSDAVPATIELTAVGGSGDTLEWFSGSCGGIPVGTNTPLIIAAPTSTTTYYARWTNGCGSSTCASVTVTVNAAPVAPGSASVDSPMYCTGTAPATIELTAVGGSGDSLQWYSGSCGGTPVGSGSPLFIAAPSSTTTYYARWETTACGNSACASVTVTVNASPVAPSSAGVDSPTYCSNAAPATISLSAVGGSGDSLQWYSGSCGGTPVGSGNPLVIAAPASTTTYYARWETTACGNSSCASVTVTVVPAPTANAGLNQTVCAGTVVHLNGTASNYQEISWSGGAGSFNPDNTTLVTDYTPSLSEISAGTVTLTLTAVGNTPCANAQSQITITIQPCITVNLQVPGLIGTVSEGAQVCQRTVEFVITSCPSSTDTRTPTVTFNRSGSNGVAQVVLANVNPGADSVAVREGHTLRKLVTTSLSGDYNDTVSVTLTSGDLQTSTVAQDNLVDIVDFSILASRWGSFVSDCGVGPNPQNCSLGADSSGDGIQDLADFNVIQINYFATGDATSNCPPPFKSIKHRTATSVALDFLVGEHQVRSAKTSIRVSDLALLMPRGVTDAMSADVNSDGVVDGQDIRDFALVNNLPLLPEFNDKLSVSIGP